jgi:hypothetical protein
MRATKLTALAATVLLAACSDSPVEPEPTLPAGQSRPAVTVLSDTVVLNSYVQSGADAIIPIVSESGTALQSADLIPGFTLTLDAAVGAPVVNGQTLQATDVTFSETSGNASDKYAYVTYATRGEPTIGAVDVYQMTGNAARLRSRAIFSDADVYSAAVSDGRLYLATSSSDPAFPERAVLEVVQLDANQRLPATYTSLRYQLPSFAGTSVHVQNGKVWAVSGTGGPNTGGLTVFRASDMARLATVTMDDARGVGGSVSTGLVVVAQGTPGRTNVFNHTTNARIGTAVASGGSATPEARGDVSVDGNWAFVAASEGGTRILRVDGTGAALRTSVPAPVVAGLDASLRTVNGVTTYRAGSLGLIFTSNGEAGVYAYLSNFPTAAANESPSALLLGRLAFPSSISANFARVDPESGAWLVVASGLGGLRILQVNN